jgi:hypothetical protein
MVRRIAFVALLLTAGLAAEHQARATCYVAFVHGAGYDDSGATDNVMVNALSRGTANAYWWASSGPWFSLAAIITRLPSAFPPDGPPSEITQCVGRIIRYNGSTGDDWWVHTPDVAAELNAFINDEGIPSGQLIIVTHSMGGLIVRFLLNGGSPGNSYYPGWLGDYTGIVDRTKYVITVQAPHVGSQGADALAGSSSSSFANALAGIAEDFGFLSETNETDSMETGLMQGASRSDTGWMGDVSRQEADRWIFTIGGLSTGPESREGSCPGNNDDCKLAAAWAIVHPSDNVAGDGLVERDSAQGFNPAVPEWVPGFWTFIDADLNHNQGRYNMHVASYWDYILNNQSWQEDYIMTHVGMNILNMPR